MSKPPPISPAHAALRNALPTSRHAQLLFDLLAERLGEHCLLESQAEGKTRRAFRRESPGSTTIVPWPVAQLYLGPRTILPMTLLGPDGQPLETVEPERRPAPPSRLRGIGPGELTLRDGGQRLTVAYRDDGHWFETSGEAHYDVLEGVLAGLDAPGAAPVERLAERLAALDVARHGSGRLLQPVPLPQGVEGPWARGLNALRDATFLGRVPAGARCAVADGYAGTTLGWGPTREAALAAWQEQVRRAQPRPPTPPPELTELEPQEPTPPPSDAREAPPEHDAPPFPSPDEPGGIGGAFLIRTPPCDVPRPEPAPENTPAALIALPPWPTRPAPLGRWVPLVDRHGAVRFGALREDPEGFTLVGDLLLAAMDVRDLDRRLDETPVSHERPMRIPHEELGLPAPPKYTCRIVYYALLDRDTGAWSATPSAPQSGFTH